MGVHGGFLVLVQIAGGDAYGRGIFFKESKPKGDI